VLDDLIAFFTSDGWSPERVADAPALHMLAQGDAGHWDCFVQAREAERQVIFYSVCPVAAPSTRREALLELLTRANYGLVVGSFEIDLDDGEVRFRTSLDVEGDRLSPALLGQLANTNVATMDVYLPLIEAVLRDNVPPRAALARLAR
jgi:hypothetical protein